MDFDPHLVLEGIAICDARMPARHRVHLHPRRVPPPGARDEERDREAYEHGIFGENSARASERASWPSATCTAGPGRTSAARRRAARIARGQARLAPHQAAVPRGQGRLRPADGHQQRRDPRHGRPDPQRAWTGSSPWARATRRCSATRPRVLRAQALRRLGPRQRPGVYEDHLGIKHVRRTHREPLRRHARRQEVQGRHPRRHLHGLPRHRPVRRGARLRHRQEVQRASASAPRASIVMDEDTDMVMAPQHRPLLQAHESCGQCTPCREGTAGCTKCSTASKRATARPRTSTSCSSSPAPWARCPARRSAASRTARTGPSVPTNLWMQMCGALPRAPASGGPAEGCGWEGLVVHRASLVPAVG